MHYRLWWLIGFSVLAVLAWLIMNNLSPREVVVYEPYKGAAASNPFYAAEQFLQRLETTTRVVSHADQLQPLPATNSSLIYAAHRAGLEPAKAQAILDWVRRGGQLIIAPNGSRSASSSDPLLAAFDIGLGWRDYDYSANDGTESSSYSAFWLSQEALAPCSQLSNLTERQSCTYKTRFAETDFETVWPDDRYLELGENAPQTNRAWEIHELQQLVEFSYGQGQVIVTSSLHPWHNQKLQYVDNAAILWAILNSYQRPAEIVFVLADEMPNLLQWLIRRIPELLTIGLLLIVLYLWRAMRRFGPLTEPQLYDTRSLHGHLAASGRFYANNGQLATLTDQLRQQCLNRLRQRWPFAGAHPTTMQMDEISTYFSIPAAQLQQALFSEINEPNDWLEALKNLQKIRNQL